MKSRSSKNTKRLRRFISSHPISSVGQKILLSPEESHHLRQSIRLEIGDRCLVTDGQGREARAQVTSFAGAEKVELTVDQIPQTQLSARLKIRVYLAMPQKGKMDYLIEKAQELGVDEFHPLETERTLVKMNEAAQSKTLLRWQKISLQATKQSGSLQLMKIFKPIPLKVVLHETQKDSQNHYAFFHPSTDALSFRQWTSEIEEAYNRSSELFSLSLFFGPEGGFSAGEVTAMSAKLKKVALGKSILKVDTAFFSAVASLKLFFNES